jgi:NAD(P)-dependent dehydrogenase (short-subunit alcohol dehydrogenase family)
VTDSGAAPAAAELLDVTGRVIVVTGASSGLGAHFAAFLAERGARVVAAARRADRLADLASRHPGITPVGADVTVAADRERLIEKALGVDGRLDVLVNNAGAGSNTPALEEPVEEFDRVVAINLSASFALSTLAAGHMVDRGAGSIVNIASILGLVASAPVPQAAYGAAKGGIVSLTRHLAAEWAACNVRVNAIAPGWFPSELTDEMFTSESSLRWIERNTPMRRPGRTGELDGTLLLLASDAGSFITGQTIAVDGGWTAR